MDISIYFLVVSDGYCSNNRDILEGVVGYLLGIFGIRICMYLVIPDIFKLGTTNILGRIRGICWLSVISVIVLGKSLDIASSNTLSGSLYVPTSHFKERVVP